MQKQTMEMKQSRYDEKQTCSLTRDYRQTWTYEM